MSNNTFTPSDVPTWLLNLQNLTTLLLDNTQLQGEIPSGLFSLPRLESVVLSNNNLSGTLIIESGYNSNMTLTLNNNSIEKFPDEAQYNLTITLDNNPACRDIGISGKYCTKNKPFIPSSSSCFPVVCSSDNLNQNCPRADTISRPYTGTIFFFAFSFSNLKSSIYYEYLGASIMSGFLNNKLPVNAVSLCNPSVDVSSYLHLEIQVFSSGQDSFNRTGVIDVGNTLNYQNFPLDSYFGPFWFIPETYEFPASWNLDKSGSVPQLQGAKWITFEELKECTNNFSDESIIGCGGYGKVYKGKLTSGQLVAIKRAQHGSQQGDLEFKTEIELLSRIHHRNVVSLVGFCYEQGEQMLIYEFISNGTLKQSLSGESAVRLDWMRRIKVALDSARGLAYMHEQANPSIIHRDIKSTNILLDDRLNAKVADFGISKPVRDTAKEYITTQVKGTRGYMDPEYHGTEQLTKKSDVYSFGIVMLELLTARAPIQQRKHIAREVREALGNIQDILDVNLGSASTLLGLQKYVNLAMKCVKDTGAERPTMSKVVQEIENIMQLATPNLDTEFYSTSSGYERSLDKDPYHTFDNNGYDRSRASVSFETELR